MAPADAAESSRNGLRTALQACAQCVKFTRFYDADAASDSPVPQACGVFCHSLLLMLLDAAQLLK
jgi:hypothetical protein